MTKMVTPAILYWTHIIREARIYQLYRKKAGAVGRRVHFGTRTLFIIYVYHKNHMNIDPISRTVSLPYQVKIFRFGPSVNLTARSSNVPFTCPWICSNLIKWTARCVRRNYVPLSRFKIFHYLIRKIYRVNWTVFCCRHVFPLKRRDYTQSAHAIWWLLQIIVDHGKL